MRAYFLQALCLVAGIILGVLANMAVTPAQDVIVDPLATLEGKTGAEMDTAYVEAMIANHETGLDLSQAILAQTENEDVRYLAAEIVTVQSDQLAMMREWLAQWFNSEYSEREGAIRSKSADFD